MTTRVAHLRLAASHSIRSAEIEVNGNTIHYRTGGHGPVLLLLHGIGGCTSTWDPVIDDLARDHRVVAMDLLGHGRSSKPRCDYSLAGHANTVRDFMAALGLRDVTVIGHSYGGGLTMQLAYQYPELVASLVLVGTGGLGREVHPSLRLLTMPLAEQATAFAVRAAGWRPVRAAAQRLSPAKAARSVWVNRLAESYDALSEPGGRAAFFQTVRGVIDASGQRITAGQRLSRLGAKPTLAIWGSADAIIPPHHIETLDGIEHGHAHVLEGAGHFPHFDQPAEFLAVVREFVASHVTAPASPCWTRANSA